MKRALTIIVIIAALAVGGYFIVQRFQTAQSAANAAFQTVTVERGDLTASVGATGTVRSNQSGVLTWSTTGRVDQVNVAIGDTVEPEQVLAQLDQASLSQSIILARADLVSAERSLEQLLNSDLARAQAQQALVAAQEELDDAREKRESKEYARAMPATIDEARANLVIAQDAVEEAEKQYDRVDNRPEDDPIRAEGFAQLSRVRKNYDTQLANLNWLLGRPDAQEVSAADARVVVAEATLKDAQREWDRLKDGPDPQDVVAAEARIAALKSTIGQLVLFAPFRGTVTGVDIKPGDQVSPGSPAFRIDDLSRLLVDVEITEVDVNRIRPGQPVMITFDAISDTEFSGKVVEVARVGTAAQGVVNFNVTVEIENVNGQVRPGMTAAANIITDLVENTLLIPNRAVRLREGKRIAYLLRNGLPQMVEVELGLTSDTMSEVVGGEIKEGDQLVLNPPTQFGPPTGGGPGAMRPGGQ